MKILERLALADEVAEAFTAVKAQVIDGKPGDMIRLPTLKGLHLFGKKLVWNMGTLTVAE